jgi:hypothetical protein
MFPAMTSQSNSFERESILLCSQALSYAEIYHPHSLILSMRSCTNELRIQFQPYSYVVNLRVP